MFFVVILQPKSAKIVYFSFGAWRKTECVKPEEFCYAVYCLHHWLQNWG